MGSLLTCFGMCGGGDSNEGQIEATNGKIHSHQSTAKEVRPEGSQKDDDAGQAAATGAEDAGSSKATNVDEEKQTNRRLRKKNKPVTAKKAEKKPAPSAYTGSKQTLHNISNINTSINGSSLVKLQNPKMRQAQVKVMPKKVNSKDKLKPMGQAKVGRSVSKNNSRPVGKAKHSKQPIKK